METYGDEIKLMYVSGHRKRASAEKTLLLVTDREYEQVRAAVRAFFPNATVTDAATPERVASWVVSQRALAARASIESICQAHLEGVKIIDLESFFRPKNNNSQYRAPSDPAGLIRFLASKSTHQAFYLRVYAFLKSCVEPLVALAMLLVLSPILVVVAILIKATSDGPIIYSQERVGLRCRRFTIFKFRSMRTDAEKAGPVWASAGEDSRLTPIGLMLRKTHLDELPQLWNVVRGDLSFIGPRPERPEFVRQLQRAYPLFGLRHLIKPGITGWAQVKQGYANSFEDSLHKLEFDLFYIAKRSLLMDIRIVFLTVKLLFAGGTEGLKQLKAIEDLPRIDPALFATPEANMTSKGDLELQISYSLDESSEAQAS